jgi:hypothetical protein
LTLQELYTVVSGKLNETTPTFYPTSEIIAAVNEGQRFFCLLTLVLETTEPWTITPGQLFFNLLPVFTDMIVPLRIADTQRVKVRPARLEDLSSLDAQWPLALGPPQRYVRIGADLVALYPSPIVTTTALVTYAQAPATLANDADAPQIPVQYHPKLADYAINRVRQVEGAAALEQTLPLLGSFLDAAQACADYVRARNRGNQYDVQPFEFSAFDRSQLLKLRKDLVPSRRPPVE